jgi:DNA-binding transcriptional LysR family regulator
MSQKRETIDVNLLRVLHAVLTEQSVTRAAAGLGQSQPAISAALKRLRDISGDPLLVRSKNGMTPTPYAMQLLEPVGQALQGIGQILTPQPFFDPASSTRCYRIGCPDYLSARLMPTVIENFRSFASQANIEFHTLGSGFDYEAALENGGLDLVIGNWPDAPAHLYRTNLFADQLVCLVSRDHSFAHGDLPTVKQYLEAHHVAAIAYSNSRRGTIDILLSRLRLKRHVAVTLPHLNVAPYVLLQTDLVLTTTRIFAEYYANILPLAVVSTPVEFPPVQYYQLWHERCHHSQAVRWLRGMVATAVHALTASAAI